MPALRSRHAILLTAFLVLVSAAAFGGAQPGTAGAPVVPEVPAAPPAPAPPAAAGGAGTRPATRPVTAASRVVAVTVYQGSALVTREVDVKEGQGLVEVVVSPLPPETVDSSLYTEGSDGMRVLSTRYRTSAVKEDAREEVRALQQRVAEIELAGRDLQKQLEVATQNMQLLNKLETFTGATLQQLTDKGMLNPESTTKLATYVMEQRSEKSKGALQLEEKLRTNREAADFARRQLGEVVSGGGRTERDAVIVVDKANAAAGKVRLNYLVGAASWRPQYKLRAAADGAAPGNAAPANPPGGVAQPAQPAVSLEYLAEITQQSGEDWGGVEVVLSTAEPMLNAAPPELLALDITVSGGRAAPGGPATRPTLGRDNYDYRQTLRRQAQVELNRNKSSAGWWLNNDAAALEQTAELLTKEEDVDAGNGFGPGGIPREGPSVTYRLKSKLTIPSRNDPQLIEVARIDLPPSYFYKAVPVLSPHVYRLAILTNKSDFVLLPGEATMYVGTDFVGRMNLPLVVIGEQFTVGFGVDPQLQVKRELLAKVRSIQGGNQVMTYDYRIRASSFKSTDVSLQVWDRLPRGDAEAVGVALVKSSPELSADATYLRADRPKNLLRWDLTVKAGAGGEKATQVDYQFRLEWARDVAIGNFKATR